MKIPTCGAAVARIVDEGVGVAPAFIQIGDILGHPGVFIHWLSIPPKATVLEAKHIASPQVLPSADFFAASDILSGVAVEYDSLRQARSKANQSLLKRYVNCNLKKKESFTKTWIPFHLISC